MHLLGPFYTDLCSLMPVTCPSAVGFSALVPRPRCTKSARVACTLRVEMHGALYPKGPLGLLHDAERVRNSQGECFEAEWRFTGYVAPSRLVPEERLSVGW